MFKIRILIFKDPEAEERGYSLKGIRVPLTSFCPVKSDPSIIGYDDTKVHGLCAEYWDIPTCLLILARPSLAPYLRKINYLLIPTEWCDIAPIDWDGQYNLKI